MNTPEKGEIGEYIDTGRLFEKTASFAVRRGQITETPGMDYGRTFTLENIPPLAIDGSKWRIIYTSSQDAEEGVEGDVLEVVSDDGQLIKSVLFFRERLTGEITSSIDYSEAGVQESGLPDVPEDPEERSELLRQILEEKMQDPDAMRRFEEYIRFEIHGGSEPTPEDMLSIMDVARRLNDWYGQ